MKNNNKIMICSSVIIVSILALAIFWFTQLVLTSANDTTHDSEITPEYQDSQNGPDLSQIYVSHSSGYYETAIKLEMYPPEGYDIYYTVTMSAARSLTDGRYAPTGESYFFIGGKDPDPSKLDTEEREEYGNSLFNSSEGRMRTYKYSKPLDFVNTSTFSSQVITVKAALFKDNVQQCPVRHFTYILGSITGDKSYEDIYGSMLISITIDDELLYDYERGIFISGKKYDEAMEKGAAIDPWTPRNYNQRGTDWERLAHVDFFEEDGTLVLSQVCGVRVAGGTSRGAQYKSLKLVAGPQYDGNERFNYRFFEGAKDVNGENITSFKKLVLRNPRNDIGGTMIRDQLLHKLGGDVGVDYQEGRNAVVYLNGKYYSIMCLHESLDADFMEDHYFVNKNNVASFLIRSDQYLFRYKQENGTDEQFKCFLSDMNYLIYNDF
ncbi:MAG: CotH kinase family protein, partial [Clostridia bacterium]|nr:CotH kinase family protein [Clostridia bacterium]